MKIVPINDIILKEFFKKNDKVISGSLCDEELYNWKQYGHTPNSKEYAGVMHGDDLFAVFRASQWDDKTIEGHWMVARKFHRKGMITELLDTTVDLIKNNSMILKIVVTVPKPCMHVIRILENYDKARLVGISEDFCIWRGNPTDVLFYEIEVK